MPFCRNCGTQVEDNSRFCPSCGAQQEGAPGASAPQSDFAAQVQRINQTTDSTASFDQADIQANKGMAVLAYFGILVLIPIFAAPRSRFARYHANQGLVLFLAEIALSVISGIFSVLSRLSALFLFSSSLVMAAGSVFLLVLAIMGIVNAVKGRAKELPVIGSLHLLS